LGTEFRHLSFSIPGFQFSVPNLAVMEQGEEMTEQTELTEQTEIFSDFSVCSVNSVCSVISSSNHNHKIRCGQEN
jgi:hypothetical protein